MKRLVWIPAVMLLLAVCFMLSAAGEGAAWPPAGKTEAGLVKTDYVSTPDDTFYIHTGPDDEEAHREYRPDYWLMAPEGGVWEEAVWYRVTFLSGDEHLRNFFESQEDGAGIYLNWDASTTAGTAEFRIDMESSDLWASFTVRPKVWDARNYSISLAASDVYVPVGRITNMNDLFTLRAYATVEPDTPCDCRILPPDGEDGAMETKDWKIDGYPYFTAKKAGDYDMVLRVSVGYALHRDFPITVHASKKVQEASVDGDAPPSDRNRGRRSSGLLPRRRGHRVFDALYSFGTENSGGGIFRGKRRSGRICPAADALPFLRRGAPLPAYGRIFPTRGRRLRHGRHEPAPAGDPIPARPVHRSENHAAG